MPNDSSAFGSGHLSVLRRQAFARISRCAARGRSALSGFNFVILLIERRRDLLEPGGELEWRVAVGAIQPVSVSKRMLRRSTRGMRGRLDLRTGKPRRRPPSYIALTDAGAVVERRGAAASRVCERAGSSCSLQMH
jgi:hypothetical protein